MLHTKFCENPPAGSGEEDFDHVTTIMSSDLHFLVPESFHTKFNSEWPSSF